MRWLTIRDIVLCQLLPVLILAVDRANWKTCDQSGFCKRHRSKAAASNPYSVEPQSVHFNETGIEATLVNSENKLALSVAWLEDSRLRVYITEAGESLRPRYHPSIALTGEPKQQKYLAAETGADSASFMTKKDGHKVVLTYKPFRIDVIDKSKTPIVSLNSRNLLKVEHFREKKEGETSNEDGFWEESFRSIADSKPYGSSSIGLDISFIGFKFLYGLPEHADSFALKSTTTTDPYRLYNLDVFEYELGNPMSLYGSIPYVIAHNKDNTIGALWLNAAETWVDVHSSTADKGVLASLVDHIRTSGEVPQVDTHFMSESGVIDLYLFMGPTPSDVFRQNADLTGTAPLPPLFALAYHQCRWNYNDEADVAAVHAAFDEHDIPMDVMWLDIEHTDGKRYFTWDPGRKMVTVIDPHIKKDDNYYVYKEANDQGLFVKTSDGETDFEGHCWCGNSKYLDYLNPTTRDYWSKKFAFNQYKGSTDALFTWNDMNEPSVFGGPETTMHKDARHFGGWEHRDVHNIYGSLMTAATYNGQLERTNHHLRPFVLSRSFFVGSQRSASIWTGDNTADWSHLRATVPMLLSLSVAGIPHVGSDVGGFFKHPDDQLIVRWYQAGAFHPFYREHAHIDEKRREPWLYSEEAKNAIRAAIRKRYSFLPYWYTTFYEHSKTGSLVMQPAWAQFPDDESTYDEEREFMVGPAILVRPVMEPDVKSVSLYLPGKQSQAWYEWDTNRMYVSPGAVYVDTPLEKIPVFQRGGTIVPIRERPRRSSKLMRDDPITLYVAAELNHERANGSIYLDDGESFNYAKNGEYLYWGFTYKKVNDQLYTITSKNLDPKGIYDPDVYVERIIIRGVRYYPRNIHLYYDDYNPQDLEFTHDRDLRLVVIRKPGAYVSREWRIDIHT
ncbi:glycosyl hydrolases family 31 domain-containing protein [Ditylenchus destructor]|uniref:Glycosyl hydrolases family 31 domain-containing protein n=1 Tax=Ditylenchus destructor TaxID=166010 RepID=A0AAD4RC41_9BILA|nr:glycosyl hydrolases family 31 domain-containing protein [Ditylenchus destructor]